jgi:hypothetical protein
MEAISTYETSVNFYQTTRRNIPEDSHLHTRRRENLKSNKLAQDRVQWRAVLLAPLAIRVPLWERFQVLTAVMVSMLVSETLISIYKFTRRYNPVDQHAYYERVS